MKNHISLLLILLLLTTCNKIEVYRSICEEKKQNKTANNNKDHCQGDASDEEESE